jgi:O-phospho-L-seryl-tRNASec:L-selenocysteinyl-tRNA synthase
MTINSLSLLAKGKEQHITYLGAMLFSRGVSGARVITGLSNKTIEGYVFRGYGSSHDMYNCAYITFACAIGMEKEVCSEQNFLKK